MTIIEQVLQVSEVSHALQHFPVFTKWNKLLFKEMYGAYTSGSSCNKDDDSAVSWYKNELELFDRRIVLARRLRDCGVFHKTADVYLSAAITNRRQ